MSLAWLDEVYRAALTPEPPFTVSEWADAHRMLPATAAEPGRWRTDRNPPLRGIMDALSTGTAIERVVFMKSAQIGGTEAGLNWLGYVIAHAPGVMLAVMPSLDMVKRNTRVRIDPMIEATPVLSERISAARSRDSANNTFTKAFPGGLIIMTGANSASALRSTPARYLFLDEIDAYPHDVDGEGDPVALAIERAATFRGRRKVFLCSTPTHAGASRIERAFEEGDQRRFFVPCPHCGGFQALSWAAVKWPENEPGKAFVECQHCAERIEERHKAAILRRGDWRATAPGDGRTASFHLSALYSPFVTWGEIAAEFLTVRKDPARLQTWVNLKLGEPFEDRETAPLAPDTLQARAEDWGDLLPAGVLVITAGVDVQDDRLELEVVGWGKGEESWSIDYVVIAGDTTRPEPWDALDKHLARRFRHSKAVPDLPIAAVAIDSGGHRTDQVMRYSAARLNRRVWAIKGRGGPGVPAWPKRPPKPLRASLAPVHIVGVDGIKHTLLVRLRLEDVAGTGVCHLPSDRDYWWFAGLVSERPIRKFTRGVARIEWIADRGVRNEPLDCRVYATAALHGAYAAGFMLNEEAKRIESASYRSADEPSPEPQLRRVIRSMWVDRPKWLDR
ncbi:phage terminase large subunit family protein [Microvirga sp. HBU67558]|uniref:phage terminase large subunit family protein n=1 Tax=Microvirga TaxID=186650 RepID=UPI001B37A27A|nr:MULTISPECIES: phage terminase large subunit family protein [unclassified Microvirga]MBQ0822109.1 phage terminase large subunit family protein [Microvirga sp. HBU67558]